LKKTKKKNENKSEIVQRTTFSQGRVAQSQERRKIDIAAISQKSCDYFNVNLDNGFWVFMENQIIFIKLKAIIFAYIRNYVCWFDLQLYVMNPNGINYYGKANIINYGSSKKKI